MKRFLLPRSHIRVGFHINTTNGKYYAHIFQNEQSRVSLQYDCMQSIQYIMYYMHTNKLEFRETSITVFHGNHSIICQRLVVAAMHNRVGGTFNI